MRKRAPKRPGHVRKRLILDGAEEVFAASGYAGADTGALARAGGVSAPALYRYFSGKRELFLSTLENAGLRLRGIWQRLVDGAADPLDAVWTIGLGYYDHTVSRAPVMRLWFQAVAAADDPDVRAALRENFGAFVDVLQRNLDEGKRRGLVSPDVDTRVAAWSFMGIGLTFDLIHLAGLDQELDRSKVEHWGRLYLKSIREGPDAYPDAHAASVG